MAIGWISLLKAVPWKDVIVNAPKVADGARKLWESASRKAGKSEAASATGLSASAGDRTFAALEARLLTLEKDRAELHEQMLASSRLIKSLAEQNAQLIRRSETNRIWIFILAAAVVVLGAAAFFTVASALS